MKDPQSWTKLIIMTGLSIAVVVLPGCRRTPEEPTTPETAAIAEEVHSPIEVLDLPQTNTEIGLTLASVPQGLAVTLNTGPWIQLVDTQNPSIVYSFISVVENQPGIAPLTVAEFERRVLESPEGNVVANGDLETAFGTAHWVSGTYIDDDGPVEDLTAFVPHPSGAGLVVLRSVCPTGGASTEDRLRVMQELLTHVS